MTQALPDMPYKPQVTTSPHLHAEVAGIQAALCSKGAEAPRLGDAEQDAELQVAHQIVAVVPLVHLLPQARCTEQLQTEGCAFQACMGAANKTGAGTLATRQACLSGLHGCSKQDRRRHIGNQAGQLDA